MDDLLLHSDDYILKAKDYIDSWEYILAKRVLEELLEDHPDHSEGHHLLGKVYNEQLENSVMAELHLRMAIKFDSQNGAAYISYFDFLIKQDRGEEVLVLIDQVIGTVKLRKSTVAKYRAMAYELLLQFEKAVCYFQDAMLFSCSSGEINCIEEALERINKKKDLINTNRDVFRETIII